jgi:hypothetical protein
MQTAHGTAYTAKVSYYFLQRLQMNFMIGTVIIRVTRLTPFLR